MFGLKVWIHTDFDVQKSIYVAHFDKKDLIGMLEVRSKITLKSICH